VIFPFILSSKALLNHYSKSMNLYINISPIVFVHVGLYLPSLLFYLYLCVHVRACTCVHMRA
jgi:hypothetical protein